MLAWVSPFFAHLGISPPADSVPMPMRKKCTGHDCPRTSPGLTATRCSQAVPWCCGKRSSWQGTQAEKMHREDAQQQRACPASETQLWGDKHVSYVLGET